MLSYYNVILLLITIIILFYLDNINITTIIITILLLYCILYSIYCNEHFNNISVELSGFYIDCTKCGKNRIFEDMIHTYKCKYIEDNKKYHNIEDSMSYYDNKYIDIKNQCYNCVLDNNTNITIRNYKDIPSINGAPESNYYSH